jgi:hypothetical protein
MDHQEKVQMLNEVQEIRSLVLQMEKEAIASTNQKTGLLSATDVMRGGGGAGSVGGRGRRVLDIF